MLIRYSASSATGEHLYGATIASHLALKLFVITEGGPYAPCSSSVFLVAVTPTPDGLASTLARVPTALATSPCRLPGKSDPGWSEPGHRPDRSTFALPFLVPGTLAAVCHCPGGPLLGGRRGSLHGRAQPTDTGLSLRSAFRHPGQLRMEWPDPAHHLRGGWYRHRCPGAST